MTWQGRVERVEEGFVVTCEPHVMLRIKRVFEKIDKRSHGRVLLADTAENAHDLLWFLDRYPMQTDREVDARLLARRQEYLNRQDLIQQVLADYYEPATYDLAKPLRHYQGVAVDLLFGSFGLLVADDVGLGKTALAIALFSDRRARPGLACTLTHLPPQWVDQLREFCPSLRVHVLKQGRPYALPEADVYVANYHKLTGWADVLAPTIRSVAFDEVQELRTGYGSEKYSAAKHFCAHATYRLGLSATPIYNYGNEMWNVLHCLTPDRIGTDEEFGREWCIGGTMGKKARIRDPRAFGKWLRDEGLMLRRSRKEVGRELPPLSVIHQHVEADLDHLNKVAATATELARLILSRQPDTQREKFHAGGELSYLLRQATGLAKAPFVAAFVRLLIESGEAVVLYGWHHEVYEYWKAALKDLQPVFYTGRESVAQKEEAKRKFLKGETRLMILSLRSGAGLDGLQAVCNIAVFGELDWSPGVHEQCIGRVRRDGQAEPTLAYFLVTDVGSDPIVADTVGLKLEQSDGVRDPDADLIEKLEIDEHHIRRLAENYLAQRGEPVAAGPA